MGFGHVLSAATVVMAAFNGLWVGWHRLAMHGTRVGIVHVDCS